jgi:hypothetical protein
MERLTNSWANKESLPSAAKIMADHANILERQLIQLKKDFKKGTLNGFIKPEAFLEKGFP